MTSRTRPAAIGDVARRAGVRSAVAAPVVVDGRTWGVLAAIWADREPPPDDTEERMASFAELLDTAIANADSRDQLTASRARVLAAGDDARRRVVRDLHDGAQQRLVHTIVTLKLAQQALHEDRSDAEALLAEALGTAERATAEVRELAHGILPSVLTHGGLRAGVDAFVSRLDLPVDVDVSSERLPPDIEASAYFIVAEALTNVVKHARATRATVRAAVDDGVLTLEVRDDGVGGADPDGHGLVGIADRVDALGGRLRIESTRRRRDGAGRPAAAVDSVTPERNRLVPPRVGGVVCGRRRAWVAKHPRVEGEGAQLGRGKRDPAEVGLRVGSASRGRAGRSHDGQHNLCLVSRATSCPVTTSSGGRRTPISPPAPATNTRPRRSVTVVDGRALALVEHEERDQARRQLLAGVARHGVQRARRLVERLAGLQHDRFAVVEPEHHAAVDHVHVRAGRMPVSAAREPGRLVVDADGLNDEPVARREVEHGSDALAGVGVRHGDLLENQYDPDGMSPGCRRRYGLPQT